MLFVGDEGAGGAGGDITQFQGLLTPIKCFLKTIPFFLANKYFVRVVCGVALYLTIF